VAYALRFSVLRIDSVLGCLSRGCAASLACARCPMGPCTGQSLPHGGAQTLVREPQAPTDVDRPRASAECLALQSLMAPAGGGSDLASCNPFARIGVPVRKAWNARMTTINNPVLRGFNPDPSMIRVGDDFYIATSTFEWYPG